MSTPMDVPKYATAFRPWTGPQRARPHRYQACPCPRPPVRHRSWLRGRRRSQGILLALHYAAVALRSSHLTSASLCSRSLARALTHRDLPRWIVSQATFLSWLVHHKIAVKLGRNLWAAHPRVNDFAEIGPRLRVYRIGKLILEREGVVPIEPPRRGNASESRALR